jgi:hypothetical protein
MNKPYNYPLHPDALTRAGERKRSAASRSHTSLPTANLA